MLKSSSGSGARASLRQTFDSQTGVHLPDLDVVLEERGEELANQLTCQLLLLHRTEGVGEVRGDQPLLGRCTLGTTCTCFEDLDSLLHSSLKRLIFFSTSS